MESSLGEVATVSHHGRDSEVFTEDYGSYLSVKSRLWSTYNRDHTTQPKNICYFWACFGLFFEMYIYDFFLRVRVVRN